MHGVPNRRNSFVKSIDRTATWLPRCRKVRLPCMWWRCKNAALEQEWRPAPGTRPDDAPTTAWLGAAGSAEPAGRHGVSSLPAACITGKQARAASWRLGQGCGSTGARAQLAVGSDAGMARLTGERCRRASWPRWAACIAPALPPPAGSRQPAALAGAAWRMPQRQTTPRGGLVPWPPAGRAAFG